ncbi:hypothetical protein [Streptomyces sp. NPDC126514]|uniref:hypothetical protein n=1 Tax=Streptomyces sp. NPDC126514 TaxID=3155210 RepID=UPI00332DE499
MRQYPQQSFIMASSSAPVMGGGHPNREPRLRTFGVGKHFMVQIYVSPLLSFVAGAGVTVMGGVVYYLMAR